MVYNHDKVNHPAQLALFVYFSSVFFLAADCLTHQLWESSKEAHNQMLCFCHSPPCVCL